MGDKGSPEALVPERVRWLVEVRATNQYTKKVELMALFDEATRVAHIQFDHETQRMRKTDTYSIQEAVMRQLVERGCETIRIHEINRPGYENSYYTVDFSTWYEVTVTDFGYGPQYPLPSEEMRRFPVLSSIRHRP
jgi:hypothetical protein